MLGWVGWGEDGEDCRISMKGGLYLETLVKLTIRAIHITMKTAFLPNSEHRLSP